MNTYEFKVLVGGSWITTYSQSNNPSYAYQKAEYYCSEECLHKHLTEEEFDNLYDEGRGNSYWTSWLD